MTNKSDPTQITHGKNGVPAIPCIQIPVRPTPPKKLTQPQKDKTAFPAIIYPNSRARKRYNLVRWTTPLKNGWDRATL